MVEFEVIAEQNGLIRWNEHLNRFGQKVDITNAIFW